MQTSLLGALLGTFGVAQAFGQLTVSPAVRNSVMALVGSMALTLPLLAARWTNGYRWPELTAAAIVGSTAGWAAAKAISSDMPVSIVLASAVLGAALSASAALLLNSRRPR